MDDILTKICTVRPPLRLCDIQKGDEATCGFHLSRTQWDPYPWISNVETDSPAAAAGLTIGDFVIEVNGEDILGLKIEEVAKKVRLKNDAVRLLVWKSTITETENKLPTTFNLHKFSGFLQSTLQLLECPVCMEIAKSPTYQCVNGHLLCMTCRQKTNKCPMCRVTLSAKGRCLLAEKLQRLIRKTLACDNKLADNEVTNLTTTEAPPDSANTIGQDLTFYHCPWTEPCYHRLLGEPAVFPHLYKCHNGPFIQYIMNTNFLRVVIPKPGSLVFIAAMHDAIFFLRLLGTRECWLSLLGDTSRARQFVFSISPTKNVTEQSSSLPVSSLSESISETLAQKAFFTLPESVEDSTIKITLLRRDKVT